MTDIGRATVAMVMAMAAAAALSSGCAAPSTGAGNAAGAGEPGSAAGPEGTSAPHVAKAARSVYAPWTHGPPTDPAFFPIGVWLQAPKRAGAYKAAGINHYVGLWKGPTEEQLTELKKHDMRVICAMNEVGLKHRDDPTIIAWMHGDEPDNAHSMKDYWQSDLAAIKREWPDAPDRTLERWGQYGPPIPPRRIIEDYDRIRQADPSRPVLLNLGQGVAWDDYRGRGVRRGHLEDYAEYLKGCDIASYDIYPGLHAHPDVAGRLEMTALGVERLRRWSGDRKIVWNIIEAAHTVGKSPKKATPPEVRSQVWMSIIQGSRGIVYIVHQFAPKFVEAGLLTDAPEDREMLKAVTALNGQIRRLAPVLNSPTHTALVTVASSNPDVPVDVMVKRHGGETYLFAAAMRDGETTATFTVKGVPPNAAALADGEDRSLPVKGGRFTDTFKGYGVHIYRVCEPDTR